ncbi:hypothetical protein [Mucilaginibacter sp.]|uniref:carboxypeptidase-like regulatory domain-containing protein n=1 Tax=Mucilaginibacter sp. TaxID=1882438 RepID=UPI00263560AD|nr:hypothetical protein [Mucilaginibacter sp.]
MLILLAFIPRDEDPLGKLVASLQRWTDTIPQEKVYLHMDKPYYALGDTIWFKGYVTIGSRHQLSALSGAVYVDLITEKDSIVRSLKLPVTSGMVMGNFILGDDFKEGSYRIRSYTQWMRNAGEDYFFDRTITVGSIADNDIITKADYQYKTINNKPTLTAFLNYTNDEGKALADRDVRYNIIINNKVVWVKNVKTDALGSILINIPNDGHVNLAGSYITTTITAADKTPVVKNFPIKASLSQSDVQFFPESGNLVNGLSSRVAFKAVGIDGAGTAIKGVVVDDTNNEVATIETLHAGMSSFTLKPQAGKTYTARINFVDGTIKNIALPKAVDEGYVLSIYQLDKDNVVVRVNASAKLVETGQTINLIAQTGGETIFAAPVKIEKAITSISLDKKVFPSGIAQFTIFNSAGEPLNERIAFIRSTDLMQLGLKTAKSSYRSKEHVQVELDAKDSQGKGVPGNFSVTVIDESKVPVDESLESTIFSNILLTSDLKGYIENPNYYFTAETDDVNKALDNLMLTQGYRRFAWKDLAGTVNIKPAFPAEGLGVTIAGTVQTLGHKILPGANVTLMSLKAHVMKSTTTDANGRFKFDGIFMTDSIKFALQARTVKNSDKVKIILDTIPKLKLNKNRNLADVSTNITATLKTYIDNGKKLDDIYEQTGQLDRVQRLKEVRIKAKKLKPDDGITPQGMYKIHEGSADRVITFLGDEAERCVDLKMCLEAKLQGIIIEMDGYGRPHFIDMQEKKAVGLIVDGQKMTADEIAEILEGSIPPEDVAKIEVVRTNLAMVNFLGGEYILILTKLGTTRKQYNPSTANVSPKGFNKVREFYSPRYDRPGNADKLPDLRSTIYWNPYLKTDINGKTVFNYFNADGPGNYKVIVEGINAAGELGRQVYRYTVEAGQTIIGIKTLPAADKSLALITAPLDSFNKRLPVEKVYLHLDKPYYNISDTLWFKSYLLDRVNLTASKLSKLLYVDIIDDSTVVARRISVPIKDGLGWGQIPLTRNIFHEGGYTLRAYTNWMQNFGDDFVFSQRFYLGVPAPTTWMVNAKAVLKPIGQTEQLQVEIKLNRPDNLNTPVALRKVQVKILDSQDSLYQYEHYIYKETLQTGIDGSLRFSQNLKQKANGKMITVMITALEKADGIKILRIPLDLNRDAKIDVQFLPESGKLVAGLKSVVGFKAIAEDGTGTPVSGSIYNSKGVAAATFTTLYKGMGSFEFTPEANEIYTAKLSSPVVKSFTFPKISAIGTVMHINNPEKDDELKVSFAGLKNLPADSACYLIGTSRGVIYYSHIVVLDQTELVVPKNIFPSGIARFTLFKGMKPLNERAVFIDNHDQLSIKITPNKSQYNKRDSVGLEIAVMDKSGIPVQGSFSLAVTDDSQIRPDSVSNYGIMASLLINSELKGHVESPGYYTNRRDKQAWQALDNLLLTQGWTGYSWKDVFAPAKPLGFEMEKDFRITGRVSNVSNKPIPNTPVLISSQKPNFLATTFTDANGIYVFKDLPAIDSGSFFIQANNKNGKKIMFGNINVNKFKPPAIPQTLRDLIKPWYVNTDTAQMNYVKRKAQAADESSIKLTGIVLKQVEVKSKKIIIDSDNPLGPGDSDIAYDQKDIKESATINLYELLKQKVPGFKVIKDFVHYGGFAVPEINDMRCKIIIDGGALPLHIDDPFSAEELIEEMSEIKIATLRGLEVLESRPRLNRLYNMHLPAIPWIIITTVKGNGWYKSPKTGTVTYRPLPLLNPQQFYSPKYNIVSSVTEPDYRSTLYWEPNITTNQNGKANVSFYTSDIKGAYTIKFSGVDVTGGIGDGTFKLNQIKHENP